MCTYARTIFECNHEVWGARVKRCALLTVDQGQTTPPHSPASNSTPSSPGTPSTTLTGACPQAFCKFKMPHGLQSRKLNRKCDNCQKLDDTRRKVLDKLCECREAFTKRWPDYKLGEAKTELQLSASQRDLKRDATGGESGACDSNDNHKLGETGGELESVGGIDQENRDGWICSVNGEIEPCSGNSKKQALEEETY